MSCTTGFFRKREIKKEIVVSSQWVVVVNPFVICLFENEGTEEPCTSWSLTLVLWPSFFVLRPPSVVLRPSSCVLQPPASVLRSSSSDLRHAISALGRSSSDIRLGLPSFVLRPLSFVLRPSLSSTFVLYLATVALRRVSSDIVVIDVVIAVRLSLESPSDNVARIACDDRSLASFPFYCK